jgi:hypothetical protein
LIIIIIKNRLISIFAGRKNNKLHWYHFCTPVYPFAGLLKFVFVYLANTAVLCYSLTIICCCLVQNYIYWIISTENDHRHHNKFIKYEKRLRKEGNMLGLPINNNQSKSLPLLLLLLWLRKTINVLMMFTFRRMPGKMFSNL